MQYAVRLFVVAVYAYKLGCRSGPPYNDELQLLMPGAVHDANSGGSDSTLLNYVNAAFINALIPGVRKQV